MKPGIEEALGVVIRGVQQEGHVCVNSPENVKMILNQAICCTFFTSRLVNGFVVSQSINYFMVCTI